MVAQLELSGDHLPGVAGLAREGLVHERRDAGFEEGRDVAGVEAALSAGLTPVKLNCVTGDWSLPGDVDSVRAFARPRGLAVRMIPAMDFSTGRFGRVMGGNGGDCPRCNRLRLSSDGMIRPCLFSDRRFSIRELGPAEAIRRAVAAAADRSRALGKDA